MTVMFDTNVCSALADKPAAEKLIEKIEAKHQIVVSAGTFYELINGIKGGLSQDDFGSDKRKIHAMAGFCGTFLPFGFAHACITILGHKPPHLSDDGRFQLMFDAILKAESKDLLRWVIRLQQIGIEFDTGWTSTSDNIHAMQKQGGVPTTGEVLYSLSGGMTMTADESARMEKALDFVYLYWLERLKVYREKSINVGKQRGDFIDIMQLVYLCDPKITFVTNEKKMWRFAQGKTDRIISLDSLLSSL